MSEINDIAAEITGKLQGERPQNTEEFAALIWQIFKLQLVRIMEIAVTPKFFNPSVSKDLEMVYRLGDLYAKLLGPKKGSEVSPGMKGIFQAVASGDASRLRALLNESN